MSPGGIHCCYTWLWGQKRGGREGARSTLLTKADLADISSLPVWQEQTRYNTPGSLCYKTLLHAQSVGRRLQFTPRPAAAKLLIHCLSPCLLTGINPRRNLRRHSLEARARQDGTCWGTAPRMEKVNVPNGLSLPKSHCSSAGSHIAISWESKGEGVVWLRKEMEGGWRDRAERAPALGSLKLSTASPNQPALP